MRACVRDLIAVHAWPYIYIKLYVPTVLCTVSVCLDGGCSCVRYRKEVRTNGVLIDGVKFFLSVHSSTRSPIPASLRLLKITRAKFRFLNSLL